MANYPYYQQAQPQIQPSPYFGQMPRPQPYIDQTQPQMGIKGRPVSSIEEARAVSIDFDGSVFYFPDLANKRIYTKQINMDGTSTLNVYEWKNEPVPNSGQYITREEFETAITQLRSNFAQALQPYLAAPPAIETKEEEKPKIEF